MSIYLYTCKCGHQEIEIGPYANCHSETRCPNCPGLSFGLRTKVYIAGACRVIDKQYQIKDLVDYELVGKLLCEK
jgi:hypothetical protein